MGGGAGVGGGACSSGGRTCGPKMWASVMHEGQRLAKLWLLHVGWWHREQVVLKMLRQKAHVVSAGNVLKQKVQVKLVRGYE